MVWGVLLGLVLGWFGSLSLAWWLDLSVIQPLRSHEECPAYAPRARVTQRDWWSPQAGYLPPPAVGRTDYAATAHPNPLGRTGLTGRGIMPAHGPNISCMPFVLRYTDDVPYVMLVDGRLPGWRRFVQTREACFDALMTKVFVHPDSASTFFEGPRYTLATGVLDSCLNTDHAWLSADVFLVLLEDYIQTFSSACSWVPLYRAVRDEFNDAQSEGHASLVAFAARKVAAMAAAGEFEPLETRESMHSDCGDDESTDVTDVTDGEPGPDVCGGPEAVGDACSEGGSDAEGEGRDKCDGSSDSDSTDCEFDA